MYTIFFDGWQVAELYVYTKFMICVHADDVDASLTAWILMYINIERRKINEYL